MENHPVARVQPIGVKILSVLALLGAVWATAVAGWALMAYVRGDSRIIAAGKMMGEIGMPLSLAVASFLFLILLAWASGIGMGLGQRWGWYCGTFWYAYAIVRNLNALLSIYAMADVLAAETSMHSSRGPEYYYLKYSSRLVISCLIYLYLLGDNVRDYFGVSGSRWKIALKQLGACIGAAFGGSALALVL